MEGPPLGPGGEDITCPNQVAPRGQKASSTRKIKPQTSDLTERHLPHNYHAPSDSGGRRTVPLQWASPEGTFMWGEILLGAVAITYLWLRDRRHTRSPLAHTSSSPWKERPPSKMSTQRRERTT